MGKGSEREGGILPTQEEQPTDPIAQEGAEWEKLWGVYPPQRMIDERERIKHLAIKSPGSLNQDQIHWLNEFDSEIF
jgi:hypothetical protein